MSMTQKLATAFQTGASFTADQITSRFGLANPHEAVRQLRNNGYCIYNNRGTYRLGTPTKRMVALANAVAGGVIFQGK